MRGPNTGNAAAARVVRGWPLLIPMIVLFTPSAIDAQEDEAPASTADDETASMHTVEAVRVAEPPTIDGALDEVFWENVEPVTGFLQRNPVDGAPATERTEVRVAYDADALYFALELFDSEPAAIRRSILHREGRIDQDDRVIIALDTYNDGRNAYVFELNPFGTQGDALITDERMTLSDWNWEGVYRSQGRITEHGWTVEVAIPFTTIRFAEEARPEMGIAFYRSIRRKNEEVTWPHIGQRYRSGIFQVSRYATLTGLQDLRRGQHLEVKPYAIGGAQRLDGPKRSGETRTLEDVGLDLKYGVTSNLALDLTWNTDFAQVEADNVQINLTRFDLFFPEKREFFLERANLFTFGDPQETEVFFSRRIGLASDIVGGGRLTGTVGPLSVGFLDLQTKAVKDDEGAVTVPRANNAVLRLRGDPLPRTTVGGIFTNMQGDGFHNRVAGADVNARFWGSSTLKGWWARMWESGERARGAGSAELELRNERASLTLGYTDIDPGFEPALGFVQRTDMKRTRLGAAWFPRFETNPWARQTVHAFRVDLISGETGKQSEGWLLHNMLTLQSGDFLSLNLRRRFERLEEAEPIRGRLLPAGDYAFEFVTASVRTNESREFSGRLQLQAGEFWSGTRTRYGGGATWKTGPHLTLSVNADRNDIELPVDDGDFSTTVFGLDVLAALSRKLFANALVQWDDVSDVLRANVRIDWIHTPGSDLFVVIDTGYFTGDLLDPRETRWRKRTGIMKLTYLKMF